MKCSARLAAMFAACGLAATLAVAQPAEPPPALPPGEAVHQPDPAAARERLQRRIEDMRRQLERAENALKAIDAGRPVEEAMAELGGPPGREGGREGGPGREAGREGRGGPGPGPGRDQPMSPEERDRIRDFVREHFPQLSDRLDLAQKGSPQRADRLLGMMRPRLLELMDLKRRDPDLFELKLADTQAFMLALETARDLRRLRAEGAPPADLAAAEAKVREQVAASVEAQLKFKTREIESLGGRIEELRKELDELRADREQIIDQRTKRLISGRPGDDREGGPGGGPGGEGFRGGRGPRGDGPRPEPR